MTRMFSKMAVMAALAVAGGCVSHPASTPYSIDGSRSDGTVLMAATAGVLEEVDWVKAGITAADICRSWGYSSAEAFGGYRRKCQLPGAWGSCAVWEVERKYQCMD